MHGSKARRWRTTEWCTTWQGSTWRGRCGWSSPRKRRRGVAADIHQSVKERWKADIPLTGKAIALAGDVLFVAGTPLKFPKGDLSKAYDGRMGGMLWAVSAKDGSKLAEYTLDAPPLWDSMVVVKGKLLLCTSDGQLRCFVGEK